MTQTAETTRTFRVHARHMDVHHARTLAEPSFEAAAVAFVEHLHDLPADGEEISVVVRDVGGGQLPRDETGENAGQGA